MDTPSQILMDDTSKMKSHPRKVFLGLTSFQMLAMFRRGLFYTFLSIYMRSFLGLSVTATTLYASIPMVLSSFFQTFVWGKLSDRLQKRRTLVITGEFIAGTLLLITYWIHAAIDDLKIAGYVIIIGLSIIEIFWSMSNIGWSSLVSDLYPSAERSRVMAQLTSLGGLGRIVGISLGGLLYEFNYVGWGFRDGALFYLSSAAMFLSALPLFLVPEGGIKSTYIIPETQKVNLSSQGPSNFEIMEPAQMEPAQIDPAHAKKIFIVLIIALMFINFGRNSISVIYSQYLDLPGLFSQDMSSILLSYIANTRSFATIFIGLFVGMFRKKFGTGNILLVGVILAIFYLYLTTFATLPIVFIGSFFAGASEVIITAASYEYAAELIPEKVRAKMMGIYNASFFLSWGLAGTLIIGPIVDTLNKNGFNEIYSYTIGFYTAIGITIVGFMIFLGLHLYRKKALK